MLIIAAFNCAINLKFGLDRFGGGLTGSEPRRRESESIGKLSKLKMMS